jgi:chitodextrinase
MYGAQRAGDLNVVAVAWADSTTHVTGITDTTGNSYVLAIGPTVASGITQSIYYAKNIGAASAGANTINITFDAVVPAPDVRIAEYSGLDTAAPLDKTAAATGNSALPTAGPVTTTSANEVIVGAEYGDESATGAGNGYTLRVLSDPEFDVLEDLTVTQSSTYSATAPMGTANLWVMSLATFKATASGGDTQPPSTPAGLTATVVSSSQINLSWTASTDNVGVTGYLVERCQGNGCSNFAQIATATSTTFSNSGLSASTSYTYRIRATDAAGNLSAYSSTASATTSASGDTTPPSAPTNLSATVGATVANLTWTASTDNVGVTGYRIERCQGSACSNFTQIGTSSTNAFTDTGLTSATTYKYRVRATDAAGNLSSYSNIATVSTTTALNPPSGLFVLAASSTEIDLAWSAASGGAGGISYLVERCSGTGCSNFTQIGAPATTSYNTSGLSPSTSYSYRVRATDSLGDLSAYTSVVTYMTPVASPDCN